ncbi:MAG: RrF2 family transcriptional regulator [Candidatus Bipolaricaulaceae bacterium]
MILSKRSDYGMRILYELATEPARCHSARELAQRHQVPEAFLRKILQDLRQGGVVVAQKGRRGGYMLARSPEEVSVGQVVEVLEGPIPKLACLGGDGCLIDRCCPTAPLWRYVERKLAHELGRITLADVVAMRAGAEVSS